MVERFEDFTDLPHNVEFDANNEDTEEKKEEDQDKQGFSGLDDNTGPHAEPEP